MSGNDNDDDEVTLEGTLALIKPDAAAKESQILELIREEGFLIVERARFRFSEEMAKRFYRDHAREEYFADLIDYMTSGEVVALCLARRDGIAHWREVMGPTR